MGRSSTRQIVRDAARAAVAAQEKVCGELDGIINEYNEAYYKRVETEGCITCNQRTKRVTKRHENEKLLLTCLEYSFLLRDMLVKMFERL